VARTYCGEGGNGQRLGEALAAALVRCTGLASGARRRRLPSHQTLPIRPSHALSATDDDGAGVVWERWGRNEIESKVVDLVSHESGNIVRH
jgi:hypothetical protein